MTKRITRRRWLQGMGAMALDRAQIADRAMTESSPSLPSDGGEGWGRGGFCSYMVRVPGCAQLGLPAISGLEHCAGPDELYSAGDYVLHRYKKV